MAAMEQYNMLDHGQTESGTVAARGEEGYEYLFQHIRRDARAVIAYREGPAGGRAVRLDRRFQGNDDGLSSPAAWAAFCNKLNNAWRIRIGSTISTTGSSGKRTSTG
jgi:hypothetical protein